MSRKISVITKRPGCPPRHVWMSDSLEAFQKAVGGYIESVTLASDMAILCNEEGRLLGLPYNCTICGADFVGDLVFVGIQGENFTDFPLPWPNFKRLFPQLFGEGKA